MADDDPSRKIVRQHTSFRDFPLSIMRKDLALFVQNARYIKNIVLPFHNTLAGTIESDKLPRKANWWTSAWGTFEQVRRALHCRLEGFHSSDLHVLFRRTSSCSPSWVSSH